MKFKVFLVHLGRFFGANEFTTIEVLAALQSLTPYLTKLSDTKEISNDLNRLHDMKFLCRYSVKRNIKGKSYNKGWQYSYRISNQGLSYLQYLANPEESIIRRKNSSFRDVVDMRLIINFRSRLPESLRAHAEILYDTFFGRVPLRSVEQRFPIHRDYEMHFVLQELARRNEMLKQIIADLTSILKDMNDEERLSRNREKFERLGRKLSEIEVAINDLTIQRSVVDSKL